MMAAAVLTAGVAFSGAHANASSVTGGSDVAASSGAGVLDAVLAEPDRRRIEQQRPLVAAASAIRWEIERHSYPGYAGIVLEDAQVALWWKGALPAAMADVVAQASQTAPVQVRAAAHSLVELQAAAATIEAEQSVGVHAVKVKADGSGLVVAVRPATKTGAARTAAAAVLPDVGVPVAVVQEEPLRPTSRDDDWPGWKGGATIVNTTRSSACTSGFGVRSGGASYILTAAHCGQVGDRIQDGKGEFIGNVGPRQQDHDVALVPTSSVDGYVYVGTPDDNVAAPVEGWGWTFVGEYLCQSGVTSSRVLGRPVCNLKVLFFYADREDLVEAEQTEGQPAARSGDSGGPVYSISASGKLVAKGTVTRSAGPRLGFQDYGTAWRDFGGITPATR
jgi:hypothetical protein